MPSRWLPRVIGALARQRRVIDQMPGLVLALSLAPLFLMCWEVKPVPAALAVALCTLAAILARRPAARWPTALVIAAALMLAASVSFVALFMRVAPPVTPDGHPVMPIGQVYGGTLLGILAGAALALRILRATSRNPRAEQDYLAALAIGGAIEVIVHRVLLG